jgi:hypothetical protein
MIETLKQGAASFQSAASLVYSQRQKSPRMDDVQFFNPYDEIAFTANRLPHWQQKGAVYFVTFRLADAVPRHLRTQWESEREAWLRVHPLPLSAQFEREYHERFSGAVERWLDAGHGSCVLRQRDYFDRLVRDSKHLANCIRYVRRNPEKARLPEAEFVLFESELAKGIE